MNSISHILLSSTDYLREKHPSIDFVGIAVQDGV